jgi:hypothetical protein
LPPNSGYSRALGLAIQQVATLSKVLGVYFSAGEALIEDSQRVRRWGMVPVVRQSRPRRASDPMSEPTSTYEQGDEQRERGNDDNEQHEEHEGLEGSISAEGARPKPDSNLPVRSAE